MSEPLELHIPKGTRFAVEDGALHIFSEHNITLQSSLGMPVGSITSEGSITLTDVVVQGPVEAGRDLTISGRSEVRTASGRRILIAGPNFKAVTIKAAEELALAPRASIWVSLISTPTLHVAPRAGGTVGIIDCGNPEIPASLGEAESLVQYAKDGGDLEALLRNHGIEQVHAPEARAWLERMRTGLNPEAADTATPESFPPAAVEASVPPTDGEDPASLTQTEQGDETTVEDVEDLDSIEEVGLTEPAVPSTPPQASVPFDEDSAPTDALGTGPAFALPHVPDVFRETPQTPSAFDTLSDTALFEPLPDVPDLDPASLDNHEAEVLGSGAFESIDISSLLPPTSEPDAEDAQDAQDAQDADIDEIDEISSIETVDTVIPVLTKPKRTHTRSKHHNQVCNAWERIAAAYEADHTPLPPPLESMRALVEAQHTAQVVREIYEYWEETLRFHIRTSTNPPRQAIRGFLAMRGLVR